MKDMVSDIGKMQSKYMNVAGRILEENQEIQKQQQQDYQRISDYLKDAERSAAKFWVACNQTMQKYVETAAQAMDRVSSTGMVSKRFVEENRRIADDFDTKMREYVEYQKMAYHTMEQVRKLLADISAVNTKDVYLAGGNLSRGAQKETTDKLQKTMETQAERQEALLEEISKNIRELSKSPQKGKFSLFK